MDKAPGEGGPRLRRAERRVDLLSAFARGIVCEFDSECRYRDVWATDARLLALPADELIGKTIVEAVGPEVGWMLMEGTARVYATGDSETFEYPLALATGQREFEAQIVRIPSEDGPEPYRAVALIRDITEEKAIERKLDEAERLAALGLLAAGMGHEINNPLMIIQECARKLAQGLDALAPSAAVAPLQSTLADLVAASSRIQKNVLDLRMFRRDETPMVEPVDPCAAVTRAIELALPQIQQRAVLERDIRTTPLVAIDGDKLGQVVLNLLVNAVQAMPPDGERAPLIRITTRTDDRGWAEIEIADNGRGIPAEELPRIFNPFFTTKREGMGLGLSICQRIATDHGGAITVDSAVGQGTTFRVSLPPTTAPGTPRTPHRDVELPRLRLLVIDDDPTLLRLLAAGLGDAHEVVVADGCDAGLAILTRDQRFDGVLCDLMMPMGGGMHFYRELGKIAPAIQRAVIFMTGGAFTPEATRFLGTIPNQIIEKPFGFDSVRRVLAAMLHAVQE